MNDAICLYYRELDKQPTNKTYLVPMLAPMTMKIPWETEMVFSSTRATIIEVAVPLLCKRTVAKRLVIKAVSGLVCFSKERKVREIKLYTWITKDSLFLTPKTYRFSKERRSLASKEHFGRVSHELQSQQTRISTSGQTDQTKQGPGPFFSRMQATGLIDFLPAGTVIVRTKEKGINGLVVLISKGNLAFLLLVVVLAATAKVIFFVWWHGESFLYRSLDFQC